MNNESAFAPSDSLKGEPQKLLTMKFKWLAGLKYRPPKSPSGDLGVKS